MEQTPRGVPHWEYISIYIYISSIEERNLPVRNFRPTRSHIENFHLLKINPPLSVIRHVLSVENVRLPPNLLAPLDRSPLLPPFPRRISVEGKKKEKRKDTVRVFDNPGREAVIQP